MSPLPSRMGMLSMLAIAGMLATACRGGINSACRCNTDCRAGLICQAEGEKALMGDMCFGSGVNGLCVESDIEDTDANMPSELTEAPVWDDLPSKRDFQPGGSDSLSGAVTEATGPTTGDTGTGSTGTTSTTGSTGDTTGTTGTTGDTTTGTTGTTGDGTGSTGSTSGSSSSTG